MHEIKTKAAAPPAEPVPDCYLCGSPGTPRLENLTDLFFGMPGSWSCLACRTCGLSWLSPRMQNPAEAYRRYYTHLPASGAPSLKQRSIDYVIEAIAQAAFGYRRRGDRSVRWPAGSLLASIGPLKEASAMALMHLRARKGGRLLDVGCGCGDFLHRMRRLGWQVSGIEPDSEAARAARDSGLGDIRSGTIETLRPEKDHFDAVTLNHVLEHVPDPIATLQACRESLKPGGIIAVSTPNTLSLCSRTFGRHWPGWDAPRHLYGFEPRALQACLERAGFRIAHRSTPARMAPYFWLAAAEARRAGALPGAIPRSAPLPSRGAAYACWLFEWIMQRRRPWGEEVFISARKADNRTTG